MRKALYGLGAFLALVVIAFLVLFLVCEEVLMMKRWLVRFLQVSAMTLTLAAILQEMEKPPPERQWQGRIAGFIPYDFRLPSLQKLINTYWNADADRILMPAAFGIGWGINFHPLLERLRLWREDFALSEEDFLMPTKSMKETLLRHAETR
jgi:hypothetical protein